jgi:DNA-binding NarL/FixJ family response regulator
VKTVNILIADDHELIREGIKVHLEKQPGWTVCAQANNGRQAVELARRLKPDIVVMDIAMAELNGIEATRQIRKAFPRIQVLILTFQESEDLIREALAAGARGFILKTDAARLIKLAITALLEGKPFFTGKVSKLVLEGFLDPEQRINPGTIPSSRLTAREREIVQLLCEAKTSKEIAAKLGVSFKTIEAHRANLMRKLDLHSIAELVRYAVRNKMVEV